MTARPATGTRPSLRVERTLLRDGHRLVAGMDEVGRGALAGPVSVGVVVVDELTRTVPAGVRDSKLVAATERERLAPRVRRWAVAHAVGHAGPAEIDEHGIIAALRLAGRRALAALPVRPDVVILDGRHDWLTEPGEQGLLALLQESTSVPVVHTRVKADLHCSSVAAASVLAKVERDGIVSRLGEDFPHYGWAVNKGYGAPDHLAALSAHGTCEHHRRSWRLLAGAPPASEGDRPQWTMVATSDGEKERMR